MSFNPQCWYLQREAVGTKRHKYIQFDKQNKSFGEVFHKSIVELLWTQN